MICVKPFYRVIPGSGVSNVPLPCGQCVVCKINRARMWAFRMVAESGYWPESAFLTLTYADDSQIHVDKVHLQSAFKIARKDYGLEFKYFASSEYGTDGSRPHYHVCLFYRGELGFVPDLSYGEHNGHLPWWSHGIVNLGTFSRESARYTADYLLKEIGADTPAWLAPAFRLVSLGLGKRYLLDNRRSIENAPLRFGTSFIGMPRYYKKFMTNWLVEYSDHQGKVRTITESNRKYLTMLDEGGWKRYSATKATQRETNILAKQRLFSKEF